MASRSLSLSLFSKLHKTTHVLIFILLQVSSNIQMDREGNSWFQRTVCPNKFYYLLNTHKTFNSASSSCWCRSFCPICHVDRLTIWSNLLRLQWNRCNQFFHCLQVRRYNMWVLSNGLENSKGHLNPPSHIGILHRCAAWNVLMWQSMIFNINGALFWLVWFLQETIDLWQFRLKNYTYLHQAVCIPVTIVWLMIMVSMLVSALGAYRKIKQ